jgi:hypothetical protein
MRLLLIVALCALVSACGVTAPTYTSQPRSQSVLVNGHFAPAVVGAFTAKDPALEHLSVRGNPLSLASGTATAEIRHALETELSQAHLLAKDSQTQVTGTLLKNELNGRGFSEGMADVSVEFVVTRNGQETFRATKSKTNTWPSSFVGAKAIPAAAQGYEQTVADLVGDLIADPAFQAALQ